MKFLLLFLVISTFQLFAIVDFEKQILPILEERCIECHKAPFELNGRIKEPKAGLRLDGAGHIMIGSDDGPVVIVDHPSKSSLYLRVALPKSDDDIMPPKGEPLDFYEQELIRKWIAQGVDFGKWVGATDRLENNHGGRIQNAYIKPDYLNFYDKISKSLLPISEEKIESLNTNESLLIRPMGIGSPLLEVRAVTNQEFINNDELLPLLDIREHISVIDLRNTSVSDKLGGIINQFPRLTNLNLRSTGVTDKLISDLKNLDNLRTLNLSQTKITDNSIGKLKSLSKLQNLYLWDTLITPKGLDSLKLKYPNIQK
jgi:hypothetical protein